MRIPCVAVMAIQAAHQAATEKGNKADARAINGATGLKGVNATNNRLLSAVTATLSFVIQSVKLLISLRLALNNMGFMDTFRAC